MARHVLITGVSEAQKTLRSVHKRMFPGRVGPVLGGMRDGVKVIIKAWRAQITQTVRSKTEAAKGQYPYVPTGLMKKSVGVYRMKRPGRVGADAAYRITVNTKIEYPRTGDKTGREPIRVAAVAGILEHGHSRMPAKAIVRKAFSKSSAAAESAIANGVTVALEKVLNNL